MLCDHPGCKNAATSIVTVERARIPRSYNRCDAHQAIDAKDWEPVENIGTVIVERPAVERYELPANHPDAKGGGVVNTTNASGTTGLTGDTEEAKAARTKISDAAAGPRIDESKIKADTKVKEPAR